MDLTPSPKSHLYLMAFDELLMNCVGIFSNDGTGEYVNDATGGVPGTTTRTLVVSEVTLQVFGSVTDNFTT